MGVIEPRERKKDEGPICPPLFTETMDKYRELKFVQRETEENIFIYPRGMLTWQDLASYKQVTGRPISYLESEIIMGLDAILEGRDDG